MDTVTWVVTFAYSGSSSRQFFTEEFEVVPPSNIDTIIKEYVESNNRGEAKSDRIRYWNKEKKLTPTK